MAVVTTAKPFLLTSVGKKYVMGLSGLIWAGFVFGHMAGNLLLLVSGDLYNKYGHSITSGGAIYLIEAILIAAFLAHVICAFLLVKENRAARGSQGYAVRPNNGEKSSTVASRTMIFQGTLILFFLVSHILTFKYGTYYQVADSDVRDLYRLVAETFKQPGYVVWYLIALVVLGFHLSHGVGSVFQSFGLKNDKYAKLITTISWVYGIVVSLGFISQPLYLFFYAG